MAEPKSGGRTTEFWGTVAGLFTMLFGDQIIEIPSNVTSSPELMTIIIVAKILGVVILMATYIYSRSKVKEAASRPAPLVALEKIGEEE